MEKYSSFSPWVEVSIQPLRLASRLIKLAYLFTESNIFTFIVPNIAFGIFSAVAPCLYTGPRLGLFDILTRLPHLVIFNSTNLLIFDLANQRLPESIIEDKINKPWRPLPASQTSTDQVRRAMLVLVPAVLALNYFVLGTGVESGLILILTWLYNDLKGGDELLFRDPIIAVAFGIYNHGSLMTIGHGSIHVSRIGYIWLFTISAIIVTTMQVQDLKDQAGDRSRGRKTIPLALGERFSRWSVACLTLFWAVLCGALWQLQFVIFAVPTALASYIAYRVLNERTPKADSVTWKVWCLWTGILYLLPVASSI